MARRRGPGLFAMQVARPTSFRAAAAGGRAAPAVKQGSTLQMARDYYEILGVERTCTEVELKAAFRKLAMQHHPDRNPGDARPRPRFKEVNEAYSVLSDPQKRAAYDRFGHAGVNGAGGGGAARLPATRTTSSPRCSATSSATCSAARRRGARPGARPGPALRPGDQPRAGLCRRRGGDHRPLHHHLRGLRRLGRQAGHPAPPPARPAAARAACARPRASSPSSAPARAAAARAGWSPTPAATATATARCGANARCRSASRPASTTARASGWPAKATRAPAAARAATSTSSCRSARTSCSSATGLDLLCTVPVPMAMAALGGEIEAPCLTGADD